MVVGYVETCEDHPDSDHMHVVKVNVGGDERFRSCAGAPNIAAGIKVPVATIGAVLPGDFKIKKSKLRGVTSMGMCCSKRELGMGTDHEGIWVLPEDAQIGQPIADFMGLTDTVLDLEITRTDPTAFPLWALPARLALCTPSRGRTRFMTWPPSWSLRAKLSPTP